MDIFAFYIENLLPLLYVQLAIFILLFFLNLETLKRELRNLDKRYFLFLAALVFMMLVIYSTNTGYDIESKFWVMSVARGFSEGKTNLYFMDKTTIKGMVEGRDPFPWGPVTPFLLGLLYTIFGSDSGTVYLFHGITIALTMISFFLLGYFIFRNEKISMLLVAIFCLVFHEGFFTGGIAEIGLIVHLFVSLSLLLLLIAYKTNKVFMYMLAIMCILFTAEVRFELLFLFPLFLLFLFICRFKDIKRLREFWLKKIAPAVILFLVFLPVILSHGFSHHFWSYNERVFFQFWGMSILPSMPEGAGIFMNGFLHFWTHNVFLFLTPLAIIGIFLSAKGNGKFLILILFTFLLHNYMFFMWDNGYQEKYAFAMVVPYVLLAGLGINGIVRLKNKPAFKNSALILFCIYLIFVWGVLFPAFLFKRTADPFDTSNLEGDVKAIKNYITEEKPDILIIATESQVYKFEFLTLYSTIDLFHYISDNYFFTDYVSGENEFGINFQRGGFYFNSTLEEARDRLYELSLNMTTEFIIGNETVKEEMRNRLLSEKTYAVYDKCCCNEMNLTHRILLDVFDTELLHEGGCLKLYKLKT